VMDTLRRNAESYEMVGVEASSPQQQPSPGSPVPERYNEDIEGNSTFTQAGSIDRMAVDEPIVITAVEPRKKSSYSGPGGVEVVLP